MNQERDDGLGDAKQGSFDRRQFLTSTAAIGALPVLMNVKGATAVAQDVVAPVNSTKSIIGGYGSGASNTHSTVAVLKIRFLPNSPPYRGNNWNDPPAAQQLNKRESFLQKTGVNDFLKSSILRLAGIGYWNVHEKTLPGFP